MKLLTLIMASCLILLSAKEFSLRLNGYCFDGSIPILNAHVYVIKDGKKISKENYNQPTYKTGGFDLQFNAIENHLIHLWYIKDNYFPLRRDYTPRFEKKRDSVKDTWLLDYTMVNGMQFDGSFNNKQLILFESPEVGIKADTLRFRSIDFFNYIEKKHLEEFEICNSKNQQFDFLDWYQVSFYLKEKQSARKGWILYRSKKRA